MTFSTVRIFILTAAFLVGGLFHAHAEPFKELPVPAFCENPEVIDQANALFEQGDAAAGNAFMNKVENDGVCVNTFPHFVTFKGEEVVRRYTAKQSGTVPEIVVKGILTRTGQTVYVWANADMEENFYAESEGT